MHVTTSQPTARRSWRLRGVIALLFVTLPVAGAAGQDPFERLLTVQQIGIQEIAAPPPKEPTNPLRVVAWVDHEDNTYGLGERLQLFVQSNKDAYVTVLNVAPNGDTAVLFPNEHQPDNQVPANAVMRIPGRESGTALVVSEPVGAELIKVLASTSSRPVFEAAELGRAGVFQRVIPSAAETARMLQVVVTDDRGGEWDDYDKTIRTVSRRQTAAEMAPAVNLPTAGVGLRVAVDKARYQLLDPVTLMVRSDRDCNLMLINTGPTGRSRQIFPNRYQQNPRILAGQTVVVPGLGDGVTIRPVGPAGVEEVTAVCRPEDLSDAVIDFRGQAFPRLDRAVVLTAEQVPGVATATFTVVN